MTDSASILSALEHCAKIVRDLPPEPFFGSWSEAPRDRAIRFVSGGQDFVIAHPEFWARIPATQQAVAPFSAIAIHDLDADSARLDFALGKLAAVMAETEGVQ